MKANNSFRISVLAVVVCGLCIGAYELGRAPYETVRVTDGTFWAKLWSSSPNEIGDAFAGIFGSLAFFAAAIAVVMQSFELKSQREELRLTREVMAEQKKATQEMAISMAKQAEIFQDEQRHRDETRAKAELDELMVLLHNSITNIRQVEWRLSIHMNANLEALQKRKPSETGRPFASKLWSEELEERVLKPIFFTEDPSPMYSVNAAKGMERFRKFIKKCPSSNILHQPVDDTYVQLYDVLKKVIKLQCRLSEDQIIRIKYHEVPTLFSEIEALLGSEIWDRGPPL